MMEQQGDLRRLQNEGTPARRLATPFIVMIVLVALVMAVAMAVARPWEGGDAQQRSAPVTPTAVP